MIRLFTEELKYWLWGTFNCKKSQCNEVKTISDSMVVENQHLLKRIIPHQSGSVLLDGKDISKEDTKALAKNATALVRETGIIYLNGGTS